MKLISAFRKSCKVAHHSEKQFLNFSKQFFSCFKQEAGVAVCNSKHAINMEDISYLYLSYVWLI